MLGTIPNQPISFVPSPIIVECPDKRLPMIASPEDTLRFQVLVEPAAGTYSGAARDWDTGSDWAGPGPWTSTIGGGVCAPSASPGSYIEPIASTSFPTVGSTYSLEIDVVSITGLVQLTMGGQTVILSMPGLQTVTITAATTDGPRITLVNTSSRVCLNRIKLYDILTSEGELGCGVLVEIMDAATNEPIAEISTSTRPELFTLVGGILGVSIPLDDYSLPDCIYLRASSSCDDPPLYLCSQPIAVGDECKGTVVVRACLDHDALGFAAPAVFDVRLHASLVRPRWENDASDERWSDGTIHRYYADRQRIMDLLIRPIDETLHPFIATLWMFDHVYIDGTEYVVDADGGEPAYGDQTGTAAVQLAVRPKRELLRRVSCDAPGDGCAPSAGVPCTAPNVQINTVSGCDKDGYYVEVILYSAIGFLPDRVNVDVDGASFASEIWTSPTSYNFGPIPLASLVEIEITNKTDPTCNWSTSIQLPLCEGRGFGRFKTVSPTSYDVNIGTMSAEPQFAVIRQVGAFDLGGATIVTAGVKYALSGSPVQQERCFYGGDEDGNPLDTVVSFVATKAQLTELDVTQLCWLDALDVTENLLLELDLSGNQYLTRISAEDNLITAVLWPPGTTPMASIDFDDNATLVTLPWLPVGLIDDNIVISFGGCALDAASINMLVVQCHASGKTGGTLEVSGGANTPLPVSGAIAVMITTLTTSRGWTVTGN
jgi:hypothetical protein